MKITALSVFALFLILGCKSVNDDNMNDENPADITRIVTDTVVYADTETTPVVSEAGDDAADDPAVWIHPTDPSKSRIIGTNKKLGLAVYDLQGNETEFHPFGRVNNVDIRYNFTFDNGEKTDIVGASNRTTNSLLLMEMDENGSIVAGSAKEFDSNVNEVYGFCMYFDKNDNKHYAFINGKDGNIEQWEISDTGQRELNATVVRTLKVNTQPEGMVADDESGYLYVGEELEGIWKFVAGADEHTEKTFVPMSGEDNPAIEFDVEGLSIYYGPDLKGYLIASSQGNYTYAIFEREGENEYITSFSIGENIVDAVEETDGIAVTNTALGNAFPDGVFVVQDGYNYDGENPENQNFKYVDWRKIANLTDPPLIIDTSFNIRRFSE